MQVTVERTQSCQAKVSFTVPAQEFEVEFQKALADVGRRVRMKGFRPGHVPTSVVARMQGKELRQEVAFRFVQKAYQQAIEENKLRPLANPRIEQLADVLAGVDFQHSFEFSLRPEFELGEYKGLQVESQLPPVMPEEVEQTIEQARVDNSRPEPAGEEGLPEDGVALCKVQLFHQGAVVWERDGLRLRPNTPLQGTDPKAYSEAMVGKHDGESAELPLRFPDDFEVEAARGQEGTLRIEVKQAFRVVLPSREELMKAIGVETEDELRKRAKEGLEKANQQLEEGRIETDLLERVIAAHEMELPALMVDEQHKARLATMRQEIEREGARGEALEQQLAQREDEARDLAIKGAKAYFLIERIAEAEKLQVAEADMVAELRTIAKRNRSTFEEVRDFYQKENLFPQLAMEILERKVRRFLRESAEVVAPKV